MKQLQLTTAARRIAASIAIATALAASSAWAGSVWIGDGADEYIDTTGNRTDGTAYRGNYFVDAITNSNSGVVSYASKTTVRFNSYKDFGNADIRFGRASLTDPDKIWTVIADNDECGFKNNYNLEVGSNVNDCLGDAYLRILYGKYSTANVYIGPNANNPATRSVLSIGSDGHASIFTATGATGIEIRNGELTTTNTALTCGGNLTAANKNNSSVTIDKTGGDWCVGNLAMNTADGTTATFYNRGGNLVVTNDLTVQNRGSGEFYMEGGHVTVSNIVRFGDYNLNSGDVGNLYLNGGVFEAKIFRFHNAANWQTYGYVVLNGGTYKAMADGSMALNTGDVSTDGRKGAVHMLHFKVGERGGTIDTAGHDVVFPLRLLQDGSSNGGIVVKGGGSLTLENANVTYVGKTSVEAGTTLVVSNSTVKSNILSHGIELAGAPTPGTPYTVFRCNDDLTADDLANVTCGAASEFTPAVGEDGKSIVVTATALKSGYWTGAANDDNLSNGSNWADGNVPTSGNAEINCPVATTLTVGGTFSPDTITIPDTSAVVTIGAGNLQLNTLTNANRLAIASGASLTVEGDLVSTQGGVVLYSNEGTVVVKGDVDFQCAAAHTTYYQYEVVTDATKPIMAGGLAYNGTPPGTWHYLTVYLGKNADSPHAGQWVIGTKGLHYKSSRNIWHTGFMMGQGVTTLYSSSDWSLASSGQANSTRDLGNYYNTSTDIPNSSLVLDTNNYTNNAVSHTITLNGRLISSSTEDPAVTIKGAGTVVVDTADDNAGSNRGYMYMHTGVTNATLSATIAVTDTATLKVKDGKKIIGAGKISLAAGTTLALESTSNTFTAPDILPVALPETGTAAINIDGERLKGGVDFAICTLADLPDGYNVANHVTVTGTALTGRKYTVKTVEVTENEETVTKLVLNIVPSGLMLIFR